jgi:hypothetical protein
MVTEIAIIPPEIDLLDVEPLPVLPGMPTASEILAEMRDGERY